jgi:Hypothetical glycosyl hydrolase family 15
MTRRPWRAAAVGLLAVLLLGAGVPTHVQTFDGYPNSGGVPPQDASRWLTWAETGVAGSLRLKPFGVRTVVYTDPFRAMSGREQPEYTSNESTFAHDCSGGRIEARRANQYLMDPNSPALFAVWKAHVVRYVTAGHFDAVFADDANNLEYLRGMPCGYDPNAWLKATNAFLGALGYPVIYNALSAFTDESVSPSIALNASSIGGMMEQCYSSSSAQPKSPLSKWLVAEQTELRMAAERKLFFCLSNDTTQASEALDARLYVYASFLLSYDPSLSVLWELYQDPLRFHVMPETQLFADEPGSSARTLSDLKTPSGVYQREFRACYLAARSIGPCAVAVNPDAQAHPIQLSAYRRTLQLSGDSILDGGTAIVSGVAPPAGLAPLSAVIAIK